MKNASIKERVQKINAVIVATLEKIAEEDIPPSDAWLVVNGLGVNLIMNTDFSRENVIKILDKNKEIILNTLKDEGYFPTIN